MGKKRKSPLLSPMAGKECFLRMRPNQAPEVPELLEDPRPSGVAPELTSCIDMGIYDILGHRIGTIPAGESIVGFISSAFGPPDTRL